MSVEGIGILAFLPFVLGAIIAIAAARILVATAAGTIIALTHLANGAGHAATALAKTGYRVYQEHQDANQHAQHQVTSNYTDVRARVHARKIVEQRLKPPTHVPTEFTQADHDALRTQLAMMTAQPTEIRRTVPAWRVPELPRSVIDFSDATRISSAHVGVSRIDVQGIFREYREILRQIHQQMQAVAPAHQLNQGIMRLLQEADSQTLAQLDVEYVQGFVKEVVRMHTACTEVLQWESHQTQRREALMRRVQETTRRVNQAQADNIPMSVYLVKCMQELNDALAQQDIAQAEVLVEKIADELSKDIRQHADLLQERLTLYFADMLRDMQAFAEMELIVAVDASSPADVKDARRRAECAQWITDYQLFMAGVAQSSIGDVAAACDALATQANYLRDLSIDMAEEVQHGVVAGLMRLALDEVGFTPSDDNAPVQIYAPIVGWQAGRMVSFQLQKDGTFSFTSTGFGDAECKVIYDQVLTKLREYGVGISGTHRWVQSAAANKIITALLRIGYKVNFAERNGHVNITATNVSAAHDPVEVDVDADGRETVHRGQIPQLTNIAAPQVAAPQHARSLTQPEQQRIRER